MPENSLKAFLRKLGTFSFIRFCLFSKSLCKALNTFWVIFCFDFILKPWENEKLLSTIKAGIKLRKSNAEVEELKDQQHHQDNG